MLRKLFNTVSKNTSNKLVNIPSIHKGLITTDKLEKNFKSEPVKTSENTNKITNNTNNKDKNDDMIVYIVCETYML